MKVVIIGGVAGGASAAARLRRINEDCEIVMFEQGGYVSFANCGMPYHIGGAIEDRDELFLQTPESLKERFNIDARVLTRVTSIEPDQKLVHAHDVAKGTNYTESYDKLIIATGSVPSIPPIPGVEEDNVFTVWTIADMDKVIGKIATVEGARTAAVVGGGFVGLEMAENLRELGMKVTVIDIADQVMNNIDIEMAQFVHKALAKNGIKLCLKAQIESIMPDGVVTRSGTVPADIVIMAGGIRPNSELADLAGLKLNARGGIVTNEYLETSVPDIYAVGDVIEVMDYVIGHKTMIPLAGPANKQGRMVADNICGARIPYEGSLGSSVLKVFDTTVAFTGTNEKRLAGIEKKRGVDYQCVYLHPQSHASYYPGASPIAMKLIFDLKSGDILGIQAVGKDGVEKRVDVIATAMRLGGKVTDLSKLELCYAPPFNSAKDPVNMIGFMAENILNGQAPVIQWDEIAALDLGKSTIVDVRTPGECKHGMVPDAVNIPVDELRARLGELDKEKEIVIYCRVGLRGYVAQRILMQSGFTNVKNLSGGWLTYDPAVNTPVDTSC